MSGRGLCRAEVYVGLWIMLGRSLYRGESNVGQRCMSVRSLCLAEACVGQRHMSGRGLCRAVYRVSVSLLLLSVCHYCCYLGAITVVISVSLL